MFFVIPFAMLAAMLAGVLLGTPTLRLRGDYLAIVTLGFGEIIEIVANNLNGFTGGAEGVTRHPALLHQPASASTTPGALTYAPVLLPVARFVVVIMLGCSDRSSNSRVGRAWTAIREDEVGGGGAVASTSRSTR